VSGSDREPAAGSTPGKWATRLAVATACATWILLLVGCLVHGTGSSLACPDWPLCHGTAFPKMENGVQYEHTHRLVATAVGLLTIALAVALSKRRTEDPTLAKMGYLGVGLVCFQGLLGGITVLLRLPILVTLAHLCTSMAFFCLMTLIAIRSREPSERRAEVPALASLRPWACVTVAATFAQILLGGTVRHTASGLACFGIPLCNGELWPAHPGAHWHMSHRLFALVVAGLVIGLAVHMRRHAPDSRPAKLATLAVVLVFVQVTLGVLSVLSFLALSAVTLHLGVAALLLACNVAIFYYLPSHARERDGASSAVRERGLHQEAA
jgi:heme A synthase